MVEEEEQEQEAENNAENKIEAENKELKLERINDSDIMIVLESKFWLILIKNKKWDLKTMNITKSW